MAKGLGRGLESILGSSAIEVSVTEDGNGLKKVPLSRIKTNADQPRKEFKQEALEDLANSIREKGIIQPIVVEELPDGDYSIIAGERRFRAAGLAGLSEVPVIVHDPVSEEERLELALIENIQRADLTALEEARAYKHLMDSYSLTQEDVAQKVGKQRSTVANSLRLLKLPVEMQEAVEDGDMSAGHARAILQVVNPADQKILFQRIIAQGLSVREAEAMALELNNGNRPQGDAPRPTLKKQLPELLDLEQKFIEALGTRVEVKGNGKKGKIQINYYSADDLARLYEIFAPGKDLY